MLLALLFSCVVAFQAPDSIVERYPDGKPKLECEARRADDGSLVRHGKSVSYFANGKVEAKGAYADGRETGAWEFRFENGRIQSRGSFQNGLRHGAWKIYRESGGLELEGKYEHGLRDGTWKSYDESGKSSTEVVYAALVQEDATRGWTWAGETENRARCGEWIARRADGRIVFRGAYERGAPQGDWLHFFADGSFDGGWLSARFEKGMRKEPLTTTPTPLPGERDVGPASPLARPLESSELDRALGGDEAALREVLRDSQAACRAAVTKLSTLDLGREEDAALAEQLHVNVLGRLLGPGEPWPASEGARRRVALRWQAVVELLSTEHEELFAPYADDLNWITPSSRHSPYFVAPYLRNFAFALPPDVPIDPKSGVIGIGGGSGGRYGGKFGGKKTLVARGGSGTEQPREDALAWIARAQDESGAWRPEQQGGEAAATLAVTSQCVLAVSAEGSTILSGDASKSLLAAARWLVSQQAENGRFGAEERDGLYQHALATQAMAELAYFSATPSTLTSRDRACAYLISQMRSDGSWPARVGGASGDVATTATACMALKSVAEGDPAPEVTQHLETSFTRSIDWLVAQTPQLLAGAPSRGGDGVAPAGADEGLAAIAFVCFWAGRNPKSSDFAALLAALDERRTSIAALSPEFLMQQTNVAYQLGGDYWTNWNKAMKELLLADASKDLDQIRAASNSGGRVLAVVLRALTLQTYFRYGRALQFAR